MEVHGLAPDRQTLDQLLTGYWEFANRNVGAMLVSHCAHNAYHLGQIVLLRRLLSNWREEGPA